MRKWIAPVGGILAAFTLHTSAQDAEGPRQEARPPQREGARVDAALTPQQAAQVRQILAGFDKDRLDAAQARAIHEVFRQAGLRGGPAMSDAIRAAGFDPEKLRDLAPPPGAQGGREGGPRQRDGEAEGARDRNRPQADEAKAPKRGGGGAAGRYSLEQAMSDRAQLHTLAFSGLAFLTGDFGGSTFLPPGKVCDYFGFQYMRDIDAAEKGHNPVFLNRVAGNVLHILDDAQRKKFEDLAAEQAPQFEQLVRMRFPVIKAFHVERDAKAPAGLNRAAVMKCVGDLFAFDAELSYRRAEVFGQVATSLTAEQKAYLGKMKFGDFSSWPETDERGKLKKPQPGTSDLFNVAYMTYASEFFSWYAGSIDADVYFCPERHATYFGGFYMKDMPAMGKRDFDISTTVTGDSGEQFLETLTPDQRAAIEAIPEQERKALAEIADLRRQVSTELRKFLAGEKADREKVLALGRRYGELDGELSWRCAVAFAAANRTLTDAQRAALKKLRNLDGYQSAPAYLYSRPLCETPNTVAAASFFDKAERSDAP